MNPEGSEKCQSHNINDGEDNFLGDRVDITEWLAQIRLHAAECEGGHHRPHHRDAI